MQHATSRIVAYGRTSCRVLSTPLACIHVLSTIADLSWTGERTGDRTTSLDAIPAQDLDALIDRLSIRSLGFLYHSSSVREPCTFAELCSLILVVQAWSYVDDHSLALSPPIRDTETTRSRTTSRSNLLQHEDINRFWISSSHQQQTCQVMAYHRCLPNWCCALRNTWNMSTSSL